MKEYNRIIFVGQSGSSRAPMAAGILKEFTLNHPIEILARGMVVLFGTNQSKSRGSAYQQWN